MKSSNLDINASLITLTIMTRSVEIKELAFNLVPYLIRGEPKRAPNTQGIYRKRFYNVYLYPVTMLLLCKIYTIMHFLETSSAI